MGCCGVIAFGEYCGFLCALMGDCFLWEPLCGWVVRCWWVFGLLVRERSCGVAASFSALRKKKMRGSIVLGAWVLGWFVVFLGVVVFLVTGVVRRG